MTEPPPPDGYNVPFDPGIAEVVDWLREHGFETTDSGDGVSKFGPDDDRSEEALPYPHVAMVLLRDTMVEETHRLYRLLLTTGIECNGSGVDGAPTIQLLYDPHDQIPILMLSHLDSARLRQALGLKL